MESPDVSSQESSFLIHICADLGFLIDGGKEGNLAFRQHFGSCLFVEEGQDSFSHPVADLKPGILDLIRQAVGLGIIGINDIPHSLRAYISGPGKLSLSGRHRLPVAEYLLFSRLKPGDKADQHASWMRGKLYFRLFAGLQVCDHSPRHGHGLHIKFHREISCFSGEGDRFYLSVQAIVAQNISQPAALLFLSHGSQFVPCGGVAGVAGIQIQHHGIIGIGDAGGMSPGVLCVKEQALFCLSLQILLCETGMLFQPVADVMETQGFFIELYGVRGAPHTVCPPVI